MAKLLEMPKLSDTMEEGGIAKWLVKEGEEIVDGAVLVEIETDKATMDYISPDEGFLLKILVKAGESCALNAPIGVVGEKGEKYDLDALITQHKKSQTSHQISAEPKASDKSKSNAPISASNAASNAANEDGAQTSKRIKSSPLAKRMAAEKGIDLSGIAGTGPLGRIILRDLEGAAKGQPSSTSPNIDAKLQPESPTVAAATNSPARNQNSGDEIIPLTMMRKTIAKRLLAGKNDAPHFYLTVSADMTKLIAWRTELNASKSEQKISMNDIMVQATAKALLKHRGVNASFGGDHIVRYEAVNIAVAVALPEGLITPVVFNAHKMGLSEISRTTKDLIGRAKASTLTSEFYQGGTFTISNLGMMGIEDFTAIINPPQAAILALGATIATPWVDENNVVVVRPRMKMTLSCDHRAVDGAMGALFLQTLVSYCENPLLMLA